MCSVEIERVVELFSRAGIFTGVAISRSVNVIKRTESVVTSQASRIHTRQISLYIPFHTIESTIRRHSFPEEEVNGPAEPGPSTSAEQTRSQCSIIEDIFKLRQSAKRHGLGRSASKVRV